MLIRKTGKEAHVSVFHFPSGFFGIKVVYDDGSDFWLYTSLRTEETANFLVNAFMEGEILNIANRD
jgi:hypothetical protein